MNDNIRQLVNNPNAIGLYVLQMMMSGGEDAVLIDDVKKVLGMDMLNTVMGLRMPEALPEGRHGISANGTNDLKQTDFTKVFVWGDRGCGKTSIIGSLLAAPEQDMRLEKLTLVGNTDFRGVELKDCFENRKDYSVVRHDKDQMGRLINVHDVLLTIKSTPVTHRHYPVTFVEVPLTLGVRGGAIAKNILDTEGEQIHLLCVDSSGDIARQGEMFERLLNYLDQNGYIKQKTAGVFVVVTKIDTMYRVPRDYRDLAGQTLVTAKLRNLWRMVTNICYDKGIYGAVPITYTIGDVVLQRVVKFDLTAAERLWQEVILPKSQSQASMLEKVLRFGNGSVTAAVFITILGLATWGLYNEFDRDVKPPTAENLPYDFKAEFIKDVHDAELMGDGQDAEFNRLRKQLDREQEIMTRDSLPVLSDEDYNDCDSVLEVAVEGDYDSNSSSRSWDKVIEHEITHAGRKLAKALKKIF